MGRGNEHSLRRGRRRVTRTVAGLAVGAGVLGLLGSDGSQVHNAEDNTKQLTSTSGLVTLHSQWAGFGFRSNKPIDSVSVTFKVPKISCIATGFSGGGNRSNNTGEDGISIWPGITSGLGTAQTFKNSLAQGGLLLECPGGIQKIVPWVELFTGG